MNIRSLLRSGAQFAFGISFKKGLEFTFDYVLYPTALIWFGYVWGGVIMTVAAVALNFIIIRAYDWAKVDWLFIEALKSARDGDTATLPRAVVKLKPILRLGDGPALIAISIFDDPVTAVLYLRKGSHCYNGLSKRDWYIFAIANAIANLYWTVGIITVLELAAILGKLW